jgi:hypothetical protein
MSMGKAFERPNILPFLAAFTNSFVGQRIVKAAVFLRLNHLFPLPVSHHLTLLILQLSRLQTAGIQGLSTMQHTLEFPARSSILPNPSLNDPEALEQTLALQTLVTVLLTLKDLTSRRSYKPGRRKSQNGA